MKALARIFAYDAANRRSRACLEDGSTWVYGYNDRDELISAKRFWRDWTPHSGQQFGYLYDNIGNRQRAWDGGDNLGGSLRETVYTANGLNQYTSVQTPGYKHIAGVAFATNAVTVNSGTTERRGEWFDREITIDNNSGPVWQQVSVTAGTVTSNGGFVMPKNQQTLIYDLDGNLTFDGVWSYAWNGENRLVSMSMTNVAGIGYSNRLRLDFIYDFQGRRSSKAVSAWNGSTFTNASTQLFVYDGWNLIATLDSQLTALNCFVWGQDLSGTLTEAGGVGGLLGVLEISGGQATDCHFVCYDGNGNVTATVKADKSTSAKYEYSPFGEVLRATGPMASRNPFQFSTKFHDGESGLVYYGYRYYSPGLGRWIGRDPENEVGALNLFAAIGNDPCSIVDPDGRSIWRQILNQGATWAALVQTIGALANSQPVPPGSKMAAKLLEEKEKIRETLKKVRDTNKRRSGSPAGGPDPERDVRSRSYDWQGKVAPAIAALGFAVLEARLIALEGVISHATGTESLSPAASQMYRDLDKGDRASADLNGIEAALELSGGAAGAASMAFGVFDEAADFYTRD